MLMESNKHLEYLDAQEVFVTADDWEISLVKTANGRYTIYIHKDIIKTGQGFYLFNKPLEHENFKAAFWSIIRRSNLFI